MIYGLYLSATGVLANSHRQDVIANNLANSETVGFKRDLALFQQRRTEARERGLNPRSHSNPLLEGLGGGLGRWPTAVDRTPGEAEATSNPLDLTIQGRGYFNVRQDGREMLTRDGRMMLDREGFLVLAGGGQKVLDDRAKPIQLDRTIRPAILEDGTISQGGRVVGRIGVFDVASSEALKKHGGAMFEPAPGARIHPVNADIRSGFVERSNVEPTSELTALMDAQRQLEANANLIRFQDQTLSRLVNDVGRIG